MEDMIQKIVEMDKKAQKLDEMNKSQKENLKKEISEITEKIYREHMAQAKKTAEINKAEIKKEAEEKWIADEKARAIVMENLNKDFKEKEKQWVDTIVKRVLA